MNETFVFHEQLKRGAQGEAFLDAFFAPRFFIRAATRAEQSMGIDRHFQPKNNNAPFTVEYKTDSKAALTHNAFIETVSVDKAQKAGWLYTSCAEWLLYYVPGDDLVYAFPFSAFRREAAYWIEKYPVRAVRNEHYNTIGVIVPLVEFERHAARVINVASESTS